MTQHGKVCDMILHKAWPQFPYLPLKRSVGRGFPEVGFLIAGEIGSSICCRSSSGITLYMGNIFAPEGDLNNLPTVQYKNIAELVNAGWEVD